MKNREFEVWFKKYLNKKKIQLGYVLDDRKQIQVSDVVHHIITEMNEEEQKAVGNMIATMDLHGGNVYGYLSFLSERLPRQLSIPIRRFSL